MQRKMPCEDGGRDRVMKAANKGTARTVGHYQKPKDTNKDATQSVGGKMALLTY